MSHKHCWDPHESCVTFGRQLYLLLSATAGFFPPTHHPKLVLVYLVIYLLEKPAIHLISLFEEMLSLQYKSQAVMTGTKHKLDQLIYIPGNSIK